jgi:hypothetical protein
MDHDLDKAKELQKVAESHLRLLEGGQGSRLLDIAEMVDNETVERSEDELTEIWEDVQYTARVALKL